MTTFGITDPTGYVLMRASITSLIFIGISWLDEHTGLTVLSSTSLPHFPGRIHVEPDGASDHQAHTKRPEMEGRQ